MIRTAKFDEKIRKKKTRKIIGEPVESRRKLVTTHLINEVIPVNNEKYFLYSTAQDDTVNGLEHYTIKYLVGKITDNHMAAIKINEKQMHSFIFYPTNIITKDETTQKNQELEFHTNNIFKDLILGLKVQMLRTLPNKKELMNIKYLDYINRKINFEGKNMDYKIEIYLCNFYYEYYTNINLEEKKLFSQKDLMGRVVTEKDYHSKARTFIKIGTKEMEKIREDLQGKKYIFKKLSRKIENRPEWNLRQGTFDKLETLVKHADNKYKYSLEISLIK